MAGPWWEQFEVGQRVVHDIRRTVTETDNIPFPTVILAEMETEITVGNSFLHDGAMQKLWVTEISARVVDRAAELFGDAGFTEEISMALLCKANRLRCVFAGTFELQKIARAREL